MKRARLRSFALAIGACAALAIHHEAAAHEVRPAYLELREQSSGQVDVLWKVPARGDARLALAPELSGGAVPVSPVSTRATEDAVVQTWRLRPGGSLRGRTLTIRGLDATMTDVLARVTLADGTQWVQRFTPSAPAAVIPHATRAAAVASVYAKLGVEHILLGVDHLLFVLALLMLTGATAALAKTITAFTIAHSITLALATLGFVYVSPAPVEAAIALSIVFVAAEVVRLRRADGDGAPARAPSLASRAPWTVAFAFGLLHGFGFAGALVEIGMPQQHVPLALLFFNIGVEAGQLLFVAAILTGAALLHRGGIRLSERGTLAPAYAVGCIAMFWVFQRVAAF